MSTSTHSLTILQRAACSAIVVESGRWIIREGTEIIININIIVHHIYVLPAHNAIVMNAKDADDDGGDGFGIV